MRAPLISIIVPIYNVEDYLRQCLDSLYALDHSLIEIILVNDGSTDSSLTILNEYSYTYPSISKVVNQKNGGLSAARNSGLEVATGEWISYIDSDDFVDPKAMQRVINELNETETDIVAFDGYRFMHETKEKLPLFQYNIPFSHNEGVQGLTYLSGMIANNMTNVVTAWDKIYRKSTLEKLKLKFVEGILHEDGPHTFRLFCNNVTVKFLHERVLYYRQRAGSIINSSNSQKKMESKIFNIQHHLDLFEEKNINIETLNDYLVFSIKGVVNAKYAVPDDLFKKLEKRKLSLKKRIILQWLKIKNSKLPK